MRRTAGALSGVLALVFGAAIALASGMVEEIAEDVAKYLAGGEMCQFENIAAATETLGVLVKLDAKAAERGVLRGRLLVEGVKAQRSADLCQRLRASRATFEADIRATLAGLKGMIAMAAAPGTSSAAPKLLAGTSSGSDFIAAQAADQSAWVTAVTARVAADLPAARRARVEFLIGKCLRDMLTVAKASEAPAVDRFKAMQLATLSAMCAAPVVNR